MTGKVATTLSDPCWRKVGVWGSELPRCPELDSVLHCHNCEVFTAAARELFAQRPVPEPAPVSAAVRPVAGVGSVSVVVFRLGAFWLSLPTRVIQMVAPKSPVHPLPHRQGTVVRGLVTVRGEIFTCLSLNVGLGLKRQESKRDNVAKGIFERLVVAGRNDMRFAFRVNEIRGIHRYEPEQLQDAGTQLPDSVAPYLIGVVRAKLDNGDTVDCGCLDPDRLFPELETAQS